MARNVKTPGEDAVIRTHGGHGLEHSIQVNAVASQDTIVSVHMLATLVVSGVSHDNLYRFVDRSIVCSPPH